jgi:outer membrane protein assembly factor BamB
MGDLNQDGVADVVSGVNFWDDEPTLWALSGSDGTVLWTSDAHNGVYSDEGMVVFPDVTGDGKSELLMATPGGYAPPGRTLRLVSGGDGALVWEWAACEVMPVYTGWGYSCAVLPDLTADGIPEVAGGFGTSGSSNTGLLVCLNGATGDTLWTVWQPDAVASMASYMDVDGDGYGDVLAAIGGNSYTTHTARLYSSVDGSLLWQANPGGDCMSVSSVDRTDTHPLAVFCTFNGRVACYQAGGAPAWSYEGSGMYMEIHGGPDLNGDGTGEVVLAADNGGVMCLDGYDGGMKWTFPSGPNTWSVAWVDPVLLDGQETPCVAAASVNGRSVSLVNALNGELVWQMPFDERVYNVSVAVLDYPSPVVIAGLQDQQSTPEHAWALASSIELGVAEGPGAALPSMRNPSTHELAFASPLEIAVTVSVFDLSGRLVLRERMDPGESVLPHDLGSGCYLVRFESSQGVERAKMTVIE